MRYLLLLGCFLALTFALEPPVFPSQYTLEFNESAYIAIANPGETKGTIYFDDLKNRQSIYRDNGRFDRFCGTVFRDIDTPCNHIIIEGIPLFYFR